LSLFPAPSVQQALSLYAGGRWLPMPLAGALTTDVAVHAIGVDEEPGRA